MNPVKLSELAQHLNGTLEGTDAAVTHVASLDDVGTNGVSWLGDAKYASQLESTEAACVIVPKDCSVPAGLTVIRVDDPDLAACAASSLFVPPPIAIEGVAPSADVHPTAKVAGVAIGQNAIISKNAQIGSGTQIHAGVFIGANVTIGEKCTIWPNVVIRERVEIGNNVTIHPNSTIGADGYGYLQRNGAHVKVPQVGTVKIEDNVEIGANTAIDRGRLGATHIGRGTKIDNLVHIAHNVKIGQNCLIMGQCGIAGSSVLGDYAVLAGQVGVVDHVRIGNMAQIGAQAGVVANLDDGAKVWGMPAIKIRDCQRQIAIIHKLPDMAKELKSLQKRIKELESSTDD